MRKFGNEKMRWRLQGTRYRRGLTLAKMRAAQAVVARRAINFGKVWDEKAIVGTVRSIRKETEKFGRMEVEFLMEKGCKKGGVSL